MRSLQIDFFRGLALIIIFIDHVYNNRLGGYTLRGFGITDAAEIFFSAQVLFHVWFTQEFLIVQDSLQYR